MSSPNPPPTPTRILLYYERVAEYICGPLEPSCSIHGPRSLLWPVAPAAGVNFSRSFATACNVLECTYLNNGHFSGDSSPSGGENDTRPVVNGGQIPGGRATIGGNAIGRNVRGARAKLAEPAVRTATVGRQKRPRTSGTTSGPSRRSVTPRVRTAAKRPPDVYVAVAFVRVRRMSVR